MSLAHVVDAFDPSIAFRVPPNWSHGRAVHGGLTAALALQSVLLSAPSGLPPLQSAQMHFTGPVTGPLAFRRTALRTEQPAVAITVACLADGQLAARLDLVFAQPPSGGIEHGFPVRPPIGGPANFRSITPAEKQGAPAYTHNFEMRPAAGVLPLAGAASQESFFWMRHKESQGVDPTVALLALADGMLPAAFTSCSGPAPGGPVTWTFDLLLPATRSGWLLLRSMNRQGSDGLSIQDIDIWDESGRPLLRGRRLMSR